MARSAPQVSFSVASINYGTIDVADSSAMIPYGIFLNQNSTTMTEAIHMSISFKQSTNADEAQFESWVACSTAQNPIGRIGSLVSGQEVTVGSIVGFTVSAAVTTKVVVPAAAATAGAVAFYLHHRYQYTGYDD